MPTLVLTYDDLVKEVSYYLGETRAFSLLPEADQEVINMLISVGLRQFYFPPVLPGEVRSHQWSFLEPVKTLILRAAVTGTLRNVPTRVGNMLMIEAKTEVFDSDLVGLDIKFDDSTERYTIREYITGTTVKAEVSADSDITQSGLYAIEPTAIEPVDATTVITETSSKAFNAAMVNDEAAFAGSGDSFTVLRVDTTNNQITVNGDASSATGALTLEKHVPFGHTASAGVTRLASGAVFRQDMEDDSDTIVFSDHAQVYTISNYVGTTQVDITPALTQAISDATLTITKSFSTDYTLASAPASESTITVDEDDTFKTEHVGQYVSFLSKPKNRVSTYEVVERISDKSIRVIGDATDEGYFGLNRRDNSVAVVHHAGKLSIRPTYSNGTTTVTASTAIFDSGMVGLTLRFGVSENRYTITGFTSTTVITVGGDASAEDPNDPILVVGPTDIDSGDTFTVVNTGETYELPDDFGAIVGGITYARGKHFEALKVTSEGRIRELGQVDIGSGKPEWAAIRVPAFDPQVGQRYHLLVWPPPDSKYTMTYRYKVLAKKLDATNKYPLGGQQHSETIVASCLAAAERRVRDEQGVRWTEYIERLVSSIAQDRELITPEILGVLTDSSVQAPLTRQRLRNVSDINVTYDGVAY